VLIISDFDGTITEKDVTDLLWDDCVPAHERLRMVAEVEAGRWTMHRYIAHGYGFVREEPGRLIAYLKTCVRYRAGWSRFVESVRHADHVLNVVSNGLDLYIREFVPDSVPITCFAARYVAGQYHVELPARCDLPRGEDFKTYSVERLILQHQAAHVMYIGDGRADYVPATLCDTVFAVRGSRLADMRKAAGLVTFEFESFDTIAEFLVQGAQKHSPARPRRGSNVSRDTC